MKKIVFAFLLGCFSLLATKAQNIPRPNIPAPKGFSVNSFTGNVFYQRTDLTLRGVGFPLYATFYYNAVKDSTDYGYGNGWSFYYNAFYKDTGNMVIIQYSDAKKDTFRLVSGAYKAPTGVHDTLIKAGTVFTVRTKDGMEQVFANPSHKKLTGMKNRNGNTVSLVYTGNYPSRIRNSTGRCLLLTWANNHLSSISDSALTSKIYSYQYTANNLTTVTNPLNGSIGYVYKKNNIIRFVDENSNPVVFTYYPGSRIKQITSCNTSQLFTYIQNLRQTFASISNSAGISVTTYTFDEKGRLSQLNTPDNKKYIYTYDEQNNIVQAKSPNNKVTAYTYDANGNLLSETDAQGFSTVYTYTSLNKVATVKDKKGNTAAYSYDANGNLASITKPGSITESYTYNAQGQILTAIDGNGNTTAYTYNSDGDLIKVQKPVGSQLYEYGGGCCNLSKVTDANGNNVFMTYDLMNRLTSVKDDLGHTTTYQYDAAGNVTKETDPNGNSKNYGYDASNRLTSVQIPVGTWFYEYDGAGNFTKMTDAKGNVSTYQYDINNRLVKETDPLGNATTYAYDENGNLISKTEPKGNTVTFKYDTEDRLIERAYPGNTDKYSYDANGNMVAAVNNNITYSFNYDALNRLISKTIPTWNKTISYTYDAVGNRKTMTDPEGGVNTYQYDGNNRLISLTNHANLTTTFAYDAGGRLKRQNNANGTYATYTYDAGGRVDSILHRRSNGDTIAYNFYSFDQFGNRLTMRDKRGLHQYTYDAAHRLTGVVYADGSTEGFTIDANGNRTNRTKNGIPTNYTYNGADQLQTAGSNNYSFDANGNMVANTETGYNRSFSYDGLNRLTEVQVTAAKKWQVKYDPFGEKIEKLDTSKTVNRMLYDGDNLLEDLSNTNALINKYTTALGTDSWLMEQQGANTYYYHKDGLNSAAVLTGPTGTSLNEYQYDVYGNIANQTGSISNRILYTGRLWENSLGLYDYRSRMYGANVGRFINKDNFDGFNIRPTSLNKYSYVENNPANYIDPSGNYAILIYIAGGIVLEVANQFYDQYQHNGRVRFSDLDLVDIGIAGASGGGSTLSQFGLKVGVSIIERLTGNKYPGLDNLKDFAEHPIKDLIKESVSFIVQENLKGELSYTWNDYQTDIALSNAAISGSPLIPKFPQNFELPRIPGSQETKDSSYAFSKKIDIQIIIPRRNSGDPNEIIGTAGFDTLKRWVAIDSRLSYKILFENDPVLATAPAQKVMVYCPIDAKLNPSAFRLGDFGFGSFNFTIPANSSTYTTRLDVRDSLGVYVDVTAGLDITNRRAFWIFESIDPATGLANTVAVDKGFLPVNDKTKHNGEGYVNFTILSIASAQTGDTALAKAAIVFDTNDTIKTNTWKNTIDAVAPTSKIQSLPATIDTATITIKCTRTDDANGSGVKSYDVYYSKDSSTFIRYEDAVTADSVIFTEEKGHSYGFYTIAKDNAGNIETKTKAEQTVYLGLRVKTDSLYLKGCNSVNYKTFVITSTGTLRDTIKDVNGKDSLYYAVFATVTPITPNTQNSSFSSCDKVLYNGLTYNASTIVRDTVKSYQGCDSIYKVATITITPISPATQNSSFSSCDKVLYNGLTYTASTIVRDTVKSYQGCDSIYKIATITITQITPTTLNSSFSSCEKVLYNGFTFTASTIVRDTVKSYQGCDSIYKVATITITPITPATQNSSFSSCDKVVYNGLTYTVSTIVRDTVKSIQGCDSVYKVATITITPITPTTQNNSLSSCDKVLYNGLTYTASTIVRDTVKSYQGCDSIYKIATITITPITPTTENSSFSSCDKVFYNGLTYTASIIVRDTVKSYQGCDSVYKISTITITPITPATQNSSFSSCDKVLYNGLTYTASTIVRDTVKSYQGCDSIYKIATITITPITPTTQNSSLSSCDKVVYNGLTYTASTIVRDTVKSYQGCDSIYKVATITITPITPTTQNSSFSSCDKVLYNGLTYTASTIVRDTVKSYQGCDSIYKIATITITPITPTTLSSSLSSCDKVVYNGLTYTVSTIVRDTVKSVQGCDSVYMVATITINPITPTNQNISQSGCGTVTYNGITYTASTLVKDTVKSVEGCDSLYKVVTLTVFAPLTPSISIAASSTTIIAGTNVTFTATATNEGTLPIYQWQKNGVNIAGANSATYSIAALADKDTIGVILTSSLSCVSSAIAASNTIVITVNAAQYTLSGSVKNPQGTVIPNVTVSLNGNSPQTVSGSYNYSVAPNGNYHIKVSKNNDVVKSNGISAIDILNVQAHILNKLVLNSPYKIIASDVNNDGAVTTIDILFIKRLILGIDTTFAGERLWAFVDSSYTFPSSTNPFPYKDSIVVSNPTSDITGQSFVGVKLGDVNGNWDPSTLGAVRPTTRPIELVYSILENNTNTDEVRIPIRVKNFQSFLALQYTLNYNVEAWQLSRIENNRLGIEYNITQAKDGKVSFLWTDEKLIPHSLEDSSVLFELIFKKHGNIQAEKLALSADITSIEAWDEAFRKHDIVLSKVSANLDNYTSTEYYSVSPNPTDGKVALLINLEMRKNLTVILTDVDGRIVFQQKLSANKGISNVALDFKKGQHLTKGNYYLQLKGIAGETTKTLLVN